MLVHPHAVEALPHGATRCQHHPGVPMCVRSPPAPLHDDHLAQGTALYACPRPADLPATSCSPSAGLYLTTQPLPLPGNVAVLCPRAALSSYSAFVAANSIPQTVQAVMLVPFQTTYGVVGADGNFTWLYGCSCADAGQELQVGDGGSGAAVAQCVAPGSSNQKYIVAIVLVAVLPITVMALGLWFFFK